MVLNWERDEMVIVQRIVIMKQGQTLIKEYFGFRFLHYKNVQLMFQFKYWSISVWLELFLSICPVG